MTIDFRRRNRSLSSDAVGVCTAAQVKRNLRDWLPTRWPSVGDVGGDVNRPGSRGGRLL